MALNVDTQNLEEFPGTVKRVTLDQKNIVLTGNEGDEQFVLSFATSAYSNNIDRDSIPSLYVTTMKTGWCKSSGLVGVGGKFVLIESKCKLGIGIDWTTHSGTGIGDGYYDIKLSYNADGTPLSGESIANDMKEKIRALADGLVTTDEGLKLSYLNASVEYTNGKFFITSGSVGNYFNGEDRTSVKIIEPGSGSSAVSALGFDLGLTSMEVDSTPVREVLVTVTCASGTDEITITAGANVQVGDCMMITDGTYIDYFPALSVFADSAIGVPTSGTNGFDGIKHPYTALESKVQVLRMQDTEVVPNMYHSTVDSICRYGLKSIINQIDYSG